MKCDCIAKPGTHQQPFVKASTLDHPRANTFSPSSHLPTHRLLLPATLARVPRTRSVPIIPLLLSTYSLLHPRWGSFAQSALISADNLAGVPQPNQSQSPRLDDVSSIRLTFFVH